MKGRGRAAAAIALAVAGLAACEPAQDWRTVSIPGSALVADLPCRPGSFERRITVAGAELRWYLLTCESDGVTYGVATSELEDPTRMEAVLAGLEEDARLALRAERVDASAFDLPGATPFRSASRALLTGRRPDGRPVMESLRVFARGSRVFAASAIGTSLTSAGLEPFETGLRFRADGGDGSPG